MPPAVENRDKNSHTRKLKGMETTDYAKRMEPQHRQNDRNITPTTSLIHKQQLQQLQQMRQKQQMRKHTRTDSRLRRVTEPKGPKGRSSNLGNLP